jgi:hypothetical protein
VTSQVEQDLLNGQLEAEIGTESLTKLWGMVASTLDKIDAIELDDHATGLVLGYVQSGKTTAMMALMAAAVDRGYTVIVAFLGSTNLLLQQNSDRITKKLGIDTRSDYRWVAQEGEGDFHTGPEARWSNLRCCGSVRSCARDCLFESLGDRRRSGPGIFEYVGSLWI